MGAGLYDVASAVVGPSPEASSLLYWSSRMRASHFSGDKGGMQPKEERWVPRATQHGRGTELSELPGFPPPRPGLSSYFRSK